MPLRARLAWSSPSPGIRRADETMVSYLCEPFELLYLVDLGYRCMCAGGELKSILAEQER